MCEGWSGLIMRLDVWARHMADREACKQSSWHASVFVFCWGGGERLMPVEEELLVNWLEGFLT